MPLVSYDVAPELVSKYDRPGPRYTSYPPVPHWTTSFGEAEYRAALRDAARDTGDLALYVHVPFCPQRCLYCGCNVTVTRRAALVDAYLDRLEREMTFVVESLGTGRRVTQLHLGVGTPNVLSAAQGARLVRMIERRFAFAGQAERSLEASAALGYAWIGYDHFAVPEDPLALAHRRGALHRNFMGYTTMPAAHLIGFGMSAIGEVAGRYVQMAAEGPAYDARIDAGALPVARGHVLSAKDQAERAMLLQLMCNLCLPYTAIAGDRDATLERMRPFAEDGLVELTGDAIRITALGRFFLRNVCMELDAYLACSAPGPRYSRTV